MQSGWETALELRYYLKPKKALKLIFTIQSFVSAICSIAVKTKGWNGTGMGLEPTPSGCYVDFV